MNTASFGETKFSVGDRVKVFTRIVEEGKTRVQPFEGIVIGIKGRDPGKTFIVRKIAAAQVGVEKIFPLSSPGITKLDLVKSGGKGVRRAKLYYLRGEGKKMEERIFLRSSRKGKTSKPKAKSQKRKSAKN